MRYGLGSVLYCLSAKFGDVMLMSNVWCQTSSLQNQTNVSLCGISGKPKDIIFIIKLRAKCFSLAMVSLWRKSISLTEFHPCMCGLCIGTAAVAAVWIGYDDVELVAGTTMRRRSCSTTSSISTCDYVVSLLQLFFHCSAHLVVTIHDLLLTSILRWHGRSSASAAGEGIEIRVLVVMGRQWWGNSDDITSCRWLEGGRGWRWVAAWWRRHLGHGRLGMAMGQVEQLSARQQRGCG
jgi:hypothetical protein